MDLGCTKGVPKEVPELKSVEYWSMKRLNSELCGDFELLSLYTLHTHPIRHSILPLLTEANICVDTWWTVVLTD